MFRRFSQVGMRLSVGLVLMALVVSSTHPGEMVWARVFEGDEAEPTEQAGESVGMGDEAIAEDSSDNEGETTTETQGEWEHGRPSAMSNLAWRRVCWLRQRAVNHRVGVIRGVMRRQVDFMDRLLVRVQTLVTEHNLVVTSYEQLVNDAKVAQAAVKNSTDGVTAEPPEFECDDDDFRDEVLTFRTQLHQIVANLRHYRDSLKSLVQAVRDVWESTAGATTE